MFISDIQFVNGRATLLCAVRPDPPVNLNWTLLNVSLTSSYFDAMLNWVPPHSADVKMGWLTLQYQVQYRDNSTDKWTVVGFSSLFFKVLMNCMLRSLVNHHWITAALLVTVTSRFHRHSWSLCSRPTARCTDFRQTSCTKFGCDAKCSAGKSLENSATLCSSTFLPEVNTPAAGRLLSHPQPRQAAAV